MLDHTYRTMAETEASHWWFEGRRRIFRALIDDVVGERRALRVLDVGAGTGPNLDVLARYGDVFGLDLHKDALRFCREAEKGYRGLVRADATHLPYRDRSFDLVVVPDLLEHLDDDVEALREARRVLSPDGFILVAVPAFGALWGKQDDISLHKRRYRRRELVERIERAGLRVRRMTYVNFFLFLPIFAVRRTVRALGIPVPNENRMNNRVLNSLFRGIFGLEASLLRRSNLPFGVTLICVATAA